MSVKPTRCIQYHKCYCTMFIIGQFTIPFILALFCQNNKKKLFSCLFFSKYYSYTTIIVVATVSLFFLFRSFYGLLITAMCICRYFLTPFTIPFSSLCFFLFVLYLIFFSSILLIFHLQTSQQRHDNKRSYLCHTIHDTVHGGETTTT